MHGRARANLAIVALCSFFSPSLRRRTVARIDPRRRRLGRWPLSASRFLFPRTLQCPFMYIISATANAIPERTWAFSPSGLSPFSITFAYTPLFTGRIKVNEKAASTYVFSFAPPSSSSTRRPSIERTIPLVGWVLRAGSGASSATHDYITPGSAGERK